MSSQPIASAVSYPYPFEVNVANYVPLKLDETNYSVWKQLMLNLIESHELEGFVEGTIRPPPFPLEEHKQEEYRSWKRFDGLVKGWIFATVTEEILLKKVRLNTAGELKEVLSSSDESEFEDERTRQARMLASRYLPLYRAIRNGDWERATTFLELEPNAVREAITVLSETALMLAIGSSKRNHFVKKLMDMMSPEDVARLDKYGQTALHHAVINGNNVAAKWLVEKNPELPNIMVKEGNDPSFPAVHYAAERGKREMVDYLLEDTKLDGDLNPFGGELGVRLLNKLVYGELYDIASTFLQRYPKLASICMKGDTPLMEISYRLASFHSGTRLNFFQHLIYSGIPLKLEGNANKPVGRDVENSAKGIVSPMGYC